MSCGDSLIQVQQYLKVFLLSELGEYVDVIYLKQSDGLVEMVVLYDWVAIEFRQWGACL